MNTDVTKSCPKCQAPIPPEAPQGLCPKCLMASASIPTEAGQSPDSLPAPSLEAVAVAFPNLEIVQFIGHGGMGVVYKARQPKLDRFVALKLLPQKTGADPAFAERFNREARVLARLSHPNIVAVHDFGQAGNIFYLLMEFVDGVNLRQAMRAGRFTPAQALALVPRICDALQYAHEEGVLHRDIKPENLLLDTRGRVKIADFGIAKLLGETQDITLTASGASIGTPHYMAPEQLERPQDVDQRADVYSLGVVFYEMLTGELPIGRFAPPSEKAQMDPRVDQVVLRTLEKERERRFQSAGDVRTQVEKITASPQSRAPGPGNTPKFTPGSPSSASGWSIRAIAGAALVTLSLLEFAVAILAGRHTGPTDLSGLALFIGLPAVTGTLLAWLALRGFRTGLNHRRGGRLALLASVAWPLALLDVVLLWFSLLFVKNLQWVLFHVRGGFLVVLMAIIGTPAILGLNWFLLRRWLLRWKSDRVSPQTDLAAYLGRIPRRALLFSGVAVAVLFLLLLAGRAHIDQGGGVYMAPPAIQPNGPSGFEVAPGGSPPGSDDRVYTTTFTVPPGYSLSVAAVLCSNSVVLKPGAANTVASLIAPEGPPVQGRLSWRLLGNSTFADGAPLKFSIGPVSGLENAGRSFHIAPPEPVGIDWVGEPTCIWPPHNGYTRFLLVKGSSTASGTDTRPPTDWAVGIETRLDPIPPLVLRSLKSPVVRLAASTPSALDDPSVTTAESIPLPGAVGPNAPRQAQLNVPPPELTNTLPAGVPEPRANVPSEKLAEYKAICGLIEGLAGEERELSVQFTPESKVVRGLREQIAANEKIRKQLEDDTPGLALIPEQKAKAEVLVRDAKLFYEMGALEDAAAKLKQAAAIDPQNERAHYYAELVAEARFKQSKTSQGGSQP